MKNFLPLCFLALVPVSPCLKADLLVEPHDRLAIWTDGMSNPGYATYIEEYLLICCPTGGLNVEEFCAPAIGAPASLDTDILPFKPTLVMTSLGANVAGDRPLDDAAADAYRKAQTSLVETLKKNGVRTIVIGSPKCADPAPDPAKAAIRNKNLGVLAGIDKDVAVAEGVVYADVFGATMAAMTNARALYGDKYIFDSAGPGSPSNLVVAYAFLKALGCSGDIGALTVEDFATGRAKCSPGQWMTYWDHTFSVESSLVPFWWYQWNNSGPADRTILKCIPFDDDLDRYSLVVKNLPTAHAKVTWGSENRDFSAGELSAGINLPKEFPVSPFSSLFDNVAHAIYGRQQLSRASGNPTEARIARQWSALDQSTVADLVHVVKHSQRQTIAIQPLAEIEKQPPGPIPVIVDTDIDSDVDDVGAVALLNSFMDRGEANLLACVTNTHNAELSSAATVHAINSYYGHPSIPIGVYHGEPGPGTIMASVLSPAPVGAYHGAAPVKASSYTLGVHQRFDPDFPNDDKMPAGVDVYRKALASAADGSVVIVSIGLLENVQDLYLSKPDAVSNLAGPDLIRKKVRKIVIMANTVPEDEFIISHWPTPILWTTYIGTNLTTGKALKNAPEDNPVRFAYGHFGVVNGKSALDHGRSSWDLTAAWLGVRGPGDLWDLAWGGSLKILPRGNAWINGPQTNQNLAIVKMPDLEVAKILDAELARPPNNH